MGFRESFRPRPDFTHARVPKLMASGNRDSSTTACRPLRRRVLTVRRFFPQSIQHPDHVTSVGTCANFAVILNAIGGSEYLRAQANRIPVEQDKPEAEQGSYLHPWLFGARVRTIDRTLVTVPNGAFSAMTLENFTQRDKMLFHIMLSLRRDTTPQQVRAVLESVGKTLTEHPKIEAGATPVRFMGIGTYSLDLEVFVYILTRDGDEFLKIQQDLLLALPTQASISYSLAGQPDSASGVTAHNGRG